MVVTYNQPQDTVAFLDHYRSSHAVKASRMPGLQNYTWGVVEPLDGSESDTYLVAQLSFESKEQLLAAMASPEGMEASADMGELPHDGFAMHTYADA
ncbi:EthD family reductase [Nocardioides daphniae]|nr:EthD family reductase [Nocardioides daphniae]